MTASEVRSLTMALATPASSSNPDQAFYDNEAPGTLERHAAWMREIEQYFRAYSARLEQELADGEGRVAELGAGSCGLSVCLSKLSTVRQIQALDISAKRMSSMVERSASVLGGDTGKIRFVTCDFNAALPLPDGQLDAVLFDAALHHSRSMWNILQECNRVLKPGGLLIAQREAYLSALRARRQIENLLRTPEVAACVAENIYLLAQYRYYLITAGFEPEFIPVCPSLRKKLLRPLNGSVFADGVLYARKVLH